MGEDKSLLPFGEFDTLIQYQYNKLSKIFKDVYICSKTNKFDFKCNLILDNDKSTFSPMVALESIFDTLKENKVFIITVDTPFVTKETIFTLIKCCEDYDITIAKSGDKLHNLCGVFSKSIYKNIKDLIKQDIHKINYLIKNFSNYKVVEFENNEEFLNINTKDDYQNGKKLYSHF